MECYHYVTHTDSKGRRRRRKVVTWRGNQTFSYTSWRDTSGMIINLEDFPMTKVHFHKTYSFEDTHSQNAFNSQKSSFINANKHRDVHYNTWEVYTIDFYVEYKLCVNKENGFTACIRSPYCYLCGAFSFTYIIHDFLFEFLTARKEFTYNKCIKA